MPPTPSPWYISGHAVRQYQALAGIPDFDDASDALIEYAAETWRRYLADPARKPGITRTGAYRYRGPGPLRLQLVVSMEGRAEGDKPQLVDVVPSSEAGRSGGGKGSIERRRAKRRAERAGASKP